ncbi:hypothetical protein H5410_042409 [Solanum commersonii]|uniref:Uncharacterized protein n=1 Tax=Solanum commersonii TaxID=4109 RepID=A0A9J5XWA6_SOLCO|nr:hypothetical protein H5410_042409 [Solanum commersonii]
MIGLYKAKLVEDMMEGRGSTMIMLCNFEDTDYLFSLGTNIVGMRDSILYSRDQVELWHVRWLRPEVLCDIAPSS